MADPNTSEYNQSSFSGGMNLLGDDTRLQPNQYRIGFNLTNRLDQLDEIPASVRDVAIPTGLKQEIVTFGNYVIVFIAGLAYYRYYTDTGWKSITGFSMSQTAPRFWTVPVPVTETNYVRYAATGTVATTTNPSGAIQLSSVTDAALGSIPGLLVQDNTNQPQFIFINSVGLPEARTTQTFDEWKIQYTGAGNNVVLKVNGVSQDKREYVPVGNAMAWDDGTLYIVSQSFNKIYRSVTGRPLDFVVNVTGALVTVDPFIQYGGGNADTTAYSVGSGGISCIRSMSSGGIFVAAGNANFMLVKNKNVEATKIFGEYTFIRTFLFNATCLSDRAIFDTTGDTRFVSLTGVRSFNSIQQAQGNEGRNTPFTKQIEAAFTGIIQDPSYACGILYDNYELYAMQTIFGPAIAKFDTVNECWSSFDIDQTGGSRIKMLAKIELSIQRLYAITEDNQLYTLYIGPELAIAKVRTVGICATELYNNSNIKMNNPKNEIQLRSTRVVMNNIVADAYIDFTPYVNNRVSREGLVSKDIIYIPPPTESTDPTNLPDVNTQLNNMIFSTPTCEQGWKMFGVFSWQGGSITQFSMELNNIKPMQSLKSQGVAV